MVGVAFGLTTNRLIKVAAVIDTDNMFEKKLGSSRIYYTGNRFLTSS